MNVPHAAPAESVERVVGHVGRRQLFGAEAQDASDIHRDIAHPNHHCARTAEIELFAGVVRVAVVPGDELRGRVAARQIFPGDVQAAVPLGSGSKHDLVIAGAKVVKINILAKLHVTEEAVAGVAGQLLVDPGDRLDLGMVGGDALTH